MAPYSSGPSLRIIFSSRTRCSLHCGFTLWAYWSTKSSTRVQLHIFWWWTTTSWPDNLSLNNPPDIFHKISHIGPLIAWISFRLTWTLSLRGRYRYLLRPSFPAAFSGETNQYDLTTFDTATRYTLWYSGCTHSVNPYFELYIQYKSLEKGNDTEFNGAGGIINPKGIGNIVLDLEDDTDEFCYIVFEQFYYFPGAPKLLVSPQKLARYKVEDEFGREGNYFKVMGKRSILV